MTHEAIYPELKTMKSSEIFIEWIYIMKAHKIIKKILFRGIIVKKNLDEFMRDMRCKYGGDEINYSAISK